MPGRTPLELGLECLKAGKLEEAVQHLEQSTAANPQDHQGFNFLGVAYAQQKQYNRAIGAFQAALRLRPGIPSIHYNMGLAYQADGFNDRAREEFEKALLIDPAYSKASDALRVLTDQEEHGAKLSDRACARHTEEPAVGYCAFCHLAMCEQCKTVVRGQAYCSVCAEKYIKD